MNKILILIISVLVTAVSCPCLAAELSHSSVEDQIVEALSFPHGEITRQGNSYLVEDGVIYRLVRGKRVRPRCLVKEMEELVPKASIPALFEIDSDKPGNIFLPLLDRIGDALTRGPLQTYVIQVIGHTDSAGSDAHNLRLSQARALRVKQYLEEKCGVPAERLHVKGLGRSQPLSPNETGEGRAKNRRIELLVIGMGARMLPIACGPDASE